MAKRDLILHNFAWKVLSLLLAALMWMAIWTALERDLQRNQTLQESPVVSTRKLAVPLTLLTRADNGNQFTLAPAAVEVEITGQAAELEKLQARQVVAFVDVTTAPGEKAFRRDVRVQAPGVFKITSVTPAVAAVERIPAPK